MAIRRRTDKPLDADTAAAIEQFGAGADGASPAGVSATSAEASPVAASPKSTTAKDRVIARGPRRLTPRALAASYDELAERYAHLGHVEYEDLPDTFLLRHTGTKEDAMLIALLADVEDRSKNQILQRALLDGLRSWAEALR